MIIPNIWENQIDVPNHQPAISMCGISPVKHHFPEIQLDHLDHVTCPRLQRGLVPPRQAVGVALPVHLWKRAERSSQRSELRFDHEICSKTTREREWMAKSIVRYGEIYWAQQLLAKKVIKKLRGIWESWGNYQEK